MNLIFDTETSGFKDSRLLQLACILQDKDFKDVATMSLLVRPSDWEIEPGAQAVHGISKERAMECGLPVEAVVAVFCGLATKAKTFVGHNLDFDMGVVEGEMRRLGWPTITKEKFCTQASMTNVVKIPPTPKMLACGRRGFKSPKLVEAYRHAFGKDFESAHDAMADCRATAELFEWIKNPPLVILPSVATFQPPPPLPTI